MAISTFAFYPTRNAPSAITRAYPAVITLGIAVNYVVNEMISIRCPAVCGMPQINNKTAKIIAVNPVANTITIDLDTSGFDAFIFAAVPQIALTVPAGEINTLAAATRDNTARPGYTRV